MASGFHTAPGPIVLCTLVGEKKPPVDFTPAKPVFQVFLDPAGRGSGFPYLPFLLFCKDGGSVWATIITGAQFPTQAFRMLCSLHFPLCAFTYQASADNLPRYATL